MANIARLVTNIQSTVHRPLLASRLRPRVQRSSILFLLIIGLLISHAPTPAAAAILYHEEISVSPSQVTTNVLEQVTLDVSITLEGSPVPEDTVTTFDSGDGYSQNFTGSSFQVNYTYVTAGTFTIVFAIVATQVFYSLVATVNDDGGSTCTDAGANDDALYRGMMEEPDGLPVVGSDSARKLGARPDYDIPVVPLGDPNGIVDPNTGGMSTAPADLMNLPSFRRPVACGGTSNDPVFRIYRWQLGADLQTNPSPGNPSDVLVEPSRTMSIGEYEQFLASTRGSWVKVYP